MAPSALTVAAYLAALSPSQRRALTQVRAAIRRALPKAREGIAYKMPTYSIDGVAVLHVAAYQRHYALYPASAAVLAALGAELVGALHHKATLRFGYDAVVPAALVGRIARVRAAEVAAARRVARPRRSRSRSA